MIKGVEHFIMKYYDIKKIANTTGIQILPANEGDCILVQLPDGESTFRMLIDCGPPQTWGNILKDLLTHFRENYISIDLLIISHIDYDHIGGAIPLFTDESLSSVIKAVWYNGLEQIIEINNDATDRIEEKDVLTYRELAANCHVHFNEIQENISVKQSQTLSQLLHDRNIPINSHFEGKSINGDIDKLVISDNIAIDILTPSKLALNILLNKFQKELNSIRMGTKIKVCQESENCFDLSLIYSDENNITNEDISFSEFSNDLIDEYANASFDDDNSITNLSSISFILEYESKKYLFLGDLNNSELLTKFNNFEDNQLFFDVIKMPHHGSKYNSMKILDFVDAEKFLISTDGSKHGHPDIECISKIIARPGLKKRYLTFNYDHQIFQKFNNDELSVKYNYKCKTDM